MIYFNALIAAAQLLSLCSAEEESHFYRWLSPRQQVKKVFGRQQIGEYFPGYNPEFGSCGSGKTCADACGSQFEACNASTSLSLFCYNPSAKQTCCANGSGRACEDGYYCAWTEFDGRAYCCRNGQSLLDCGVPEPPPNTNNTSTVTIPPSTTTTTKTQTQSIITVTETLASTVSGNGGGGSCSPTTQPSNTVVTVTVTTGSSQSQITLATTTMYLPGQLTTVFSTVTVAGTCPTLSTSTPGPGPSSTSPPPTGPPPSSTSSEVPPTSMSKPPTPSTTVSPPPNPTTKYETPPPWQPEPSTSCYTYTIVVHGVTYTRTTDVPTTQPTTISILPAGRASGRRQEAQGRWIAGVLLTVFWLV